MLNGKAIRHCLREFVVAVPDSGRNRRSLLGSERLRTRHCGLKALVSFVSFLGAVIARSGVWLSYGKIGTVLLLFVLD